LTRDARREALRILLPVLKRELFEMQRLWYPRPQDRSLRELKQALERMHAAKGEAFVFLGNLWRQPLWRESLQDWPPDLRDRVEHELDWLADRMSEEIIVPRHHLNDDGSEEDAVRAEIHGQLLAAYRNEELRLEGREYEPEGPSGPADVPEEAPGPSPAVLPTGDDRNDQKAWNRVLVAEGLGTMPEASLKPPAWRELPRRPDNTMNVVAEELGLPDDPEKGPAVLVDDRTGAPAGRPTVGTRDAERAARLIEERLDGRRLEDLRACLRPGRHTEAQQRDRAALKRVVAELALQRKATREALAQAVGCNERTVRRWARAA
jgi:hypothetical protein